MFMFGVCQGGVPSFDGARNKFGAPWGQMYCSEESTCDIVGTFRLPPVIRCPGHFALLPPLDTTLGAVWFVNFESFPLHHEVAVI